MLDLAKPLFHNTFAMWLYYPEVKRDELKLYLQVTDNAVFIEHNYRLPAIRMMFSRASSITSSRRSRMNCGGEAG